MKYNSTRGGVTGLSFEEALMTPGYLPDGGICLPQVIPKIDMETLKKWATLTYPELVKQIIGLYISEEEIPKQDISALVDRALQRFKIKEVLRLEKLKGNLNVMELFHGQTMAFKDLSLSCVGQLLNYFLEKRQKHITIVVCTSGDTGSAAIESVRGLKWVDLIVILPRGRTSRIQELQMTTVIEENTHVIRGDGTSDDFDDLLRELSLNEAIRTKYNLCSVNSINWGRIMVQIAHHFYSYFQLSADCEDEVEIVIPTGSCGNITSALIAQQMGARIKLVSAVNANDVVAKTLRTGIFAKSDHVDKTLAPAMDIQLPYNMERIFNLYSDRNDNIVKQIQEDVENKGTATIPQSIHTKMAAGIETYVADDEEIKRVMKKCWQENEYLLCPHTAVAAAYHYNSEKTDIKRVCIATASPAKFDEAVTAAGLNLPQSDDIKALYKKPTRYQDMEKEDDWKQVFIDRFENIYNRVNNISK